MRSADVPRSEMFRYRTLEQRIPAPHPLRKLRMLADGILPYGCRKATETQILGQETG